MDKLSPCPFCGRLPRYTASREKVYCFSLGCPLAPYSMSMLDWSTRATGPSERETTLQAELTALRAVATSLRAILALPWEDKCGIECPEGMSATVVAALFNAGQDALATLDALPKGGSDD